MQLIKAYDLLNNKKLIFWINIISIPLFFIFLFLFVLFTYIMFGARNFGASINHFDFRILTMFLVLFFILIVVHELIHGIFFKLFNPKNKVKFGFKNGMAYATSPNSFYSRSQFIIICLAPFVLISLLLMVTITLYIEFSAVLILLAACHASACVGDFYWTFELAKTRGQILVEDTEIGMSVYLKD